MTIAKHLSQKIEEEAIKLRGDCCPKFITNIHQRESIGDLVLRSYESGAHFGVSLCMKQIEMLVEALEECDKAAMGNLANTITTVLSEHKAWLKGEGKEG